MPTKRKIQQFIRAISAYHSEEMFNPWSESCVSERNAHGFLARRKRFEVHLACPNPRILLVGEAAGYQGCRFSGIPFTSERLLLEGDIPRVSILESRLTTRTRPWSEPSATIVWGILHRLDLAERAVLFNAVPWHPEGKKGPFSNRKPSAAEIETGRLYLKHFLSLFPNSPVAALGTTASESLEKLGIEFSRLRHPAYGGAGKFREGLRRLIDLEHSSFDTK